MIHTDQVTSFKRHEKVLNKTAYINIEIRVRVKPFWQSVSLNLTKSKYTQRKSTILSQPVKNQYSTNAILAFHTVNIMACYDGAISTAVFNLSIESLESIQWSSEEMRHGLKLCQANFINSHRADV
jgi:hypothetical protein